MFKKARFGDFVQEVSVKYNWVSYNDLTRADVQPKPDDSQVIARVRLRKIDIYRLLQPYITDRFMEQFKAVIPLAVYLFLFQLFILRTAVDEPWLIAWGLAAVIIGLMFFIEGLKLGLMPFGEIIGDKLPAKCSLPVVIITTFTLGVGVTFAEPAIGALKAAGAIVNVEKAPYLYTILNEWPDYLALVVGAGVGLAAVIGMLRLIYGWSLKPLIYITLTPCMGLVLYLMGNPDLKYVLGLAWDCGAVTTGPVTVPIVLSIGIGVAAASGKGDNPLSGFGIVTLASLFPVIAVMLLALYVSSTVSTEAIIAAAASSVAAEQSWSEKTPWVEIILGARAVMPLIVFLYFVLSVVLREKLKKVGIINYGFSLAVIGMIIFNLGLSYGLSKLGAQSGGLIPAAFTSIEAVENSPLYIFAVGIFVAVVFAWFLGFGATLAEPALNALGMTVEHLTDGAFKKKTLMYAVSLGVGCGIAAGVLKIIFEIPLAYLLLPGYTAAVILTALSSEQFVNVAWDSAGVTTGPVTVPLVLAMGLGFGNAVDAIEGFGILSMASIGPILSVLTTGLWIRWKIARSHKAEHNENKQGK